MINNKKFTYLLIVVVLLIWGTIGYKVIKAFTADDDNVPLMTNIKAEKENYNDYSIRKDTTQLKLNYPDPFALVKKDTIPKVVPIKSLPLPQVIKPVTDWNTIKYKGYVRNPQSKTIIALFNINGKNIMMREGEKNNNMKLLKNMLDSVKINYNGTIKNISISSNSI